MLISGIRVFTSVDFIGIEEEALSSCYVLCLEYIVTRTADQGFSPPALLFLSICVTALTECGMSIDFPLPYNFKMKSWRSEGHFGYSTA